MLNDIARCDICGLPSDEQTCAECIAENTDNTILIAACGRCTTEINALRQQLAGAVDLLREARGPLADLWRVYGRPEVGDLIERIDATVGGQ